MEQQTNKISELYVDTYCRCVEDYHSGEQFGDWHAAYDFSINRVRKSKPPGYEYEKFSVEFDVVPGDQVFVLSMTYSDGDSFGRAEGKGEVLWVFKDYPTALEAKARWEYACDFHGAWPHTNSKQTCTFRVDGGRWVNLSNPAFDYFASVSSISLELFVVQP